MHIFPSHSPAFFLYINLNNSSNLTGPEPQCVRGQTHGITLHKLCFDFSIKAPTMYENSTAFMPESNGQIKILRRPVEAEYEKQQKAEKTRSRFANVKNTQFSQILVFI
jgi:hypothetical protein